MDQSIARPLGLVFAVAVTALLAGCNNQYEAPDNGVPTTWGQQHFLDVQEQGQMNVRRHPRR